MQRNVLKFETISKNDFQSCLTIGYNNIQRCPPASEASSANAGFQARGINSRSYPRRALIHSTFIESPAPTPILGPTSGLIRTNYGLCGVCSCPEDFSRIRVKKKETMLKNLWSISTKWNRKLTSLDQYTLCNT
ncbi:uncharacterized protein LOC141667358 isoform X2 [Apium graveolens]|uniref:uncharacterized protein LOC141667358 isoform X2 n=1 Tax=Apium graveolens TaxID=4045 RepID=UPI003D7AD2CE